MGPLWSPGRARAV